MKLNLANYRIAENRKKILIVPLVIVLIAAICMLIYGLTTGSVAKVGTDFTGGYKMRVNIGEKLTDDNYNSYKDNIVSIAENLKDKNGNVYGIKVSGVERYGENKDSIAISYYKIDTDDFMVNEVNPALKEALINEILTFTPEVSFTGSKITATYSDYLLSGNIGNIKADKLRSIGVVVNGFEFSSDTLTISIGAEISEDMKESVIDALSISDEFSGNVSSSGFVSSTVSSELLNKAILAVVVAIAFMLIYIWIRFELFSGIAAIAALFHDLVIMMCGMIIFHLEINQTIIAALITILCYSINNTIIIFDRVRENVKAMPTASNAEIVNTSVKNTMSRTVFTTLTTLAMIILVAAIGGASISVFALPIVFGLLAGFYSANFIAPSIWAAISDAKSKKSLKVKKA